MTDFHGLTAAQGSGKGGERNTVTGNDAHIRCRGQRPSLSEQLHWFRPSKFTRLSKAGVAQLHAFFENDETNADIARRMGLTEAAVWARRRSWLKVKARGDAKGGEDATVTDPVEREPVA